MDDKFVVQFEADIAKWQSDLETVKKSIGEFRSGVLSADEAIDKIGSTVGQTSREMRDNARSVKEVETATKGVTAATRGWSQSLSGRWAQEFQRQMGTLPEQIRASERAIQSLNRTMLESNLAGLPTQGSSPRLGSSFGNIVDQDAKALDQSSRAYSNLSTQIDGVIAARQRESSVFAQTLQAKMQDEQATRRGTEAYRAQRVALEDSRAASSMLEKNLSHIPENSANVQQLGSSFGEIETGVQELSGSLPRLRYALYDVSNTMAIFGAAALAAVVAPVAISASWEREFANVKRTVEGTEADLAQLEDQFVSLAQNLPVSFSTLSEIGTLAGQLNVPMNQMAEFTELVAKFAATTDVSVEQSATAFARLSQLLPPLEGGFNALGSSIALVGVNSIATERQIIAISTQIAGVANQAGMTADEVFGLSAAIASLGVQPELARGTVTRLFGQIGRAVSVGGLQLEEFGKIARMSGSEFSDAWNNAPTEAVLSFLDGIGNREGPAAEAALRAVGITSVRDVPVILRLAQNLDMVEGSLSDSARGAEEATEINRQYGIVANTVVEKVNLLNNNFQALLKTLGDGTTGPLSTALDLLTGLLQRLTDLANNPVAAWTAAIVIGLTGLVAVLALLGAAAVRGAASILALRTAMNDLNITGGLSITTLRAVTAQIVGTGSAATAASTGVRVLGAALRAATLVGVAFLGVELGRAFSEWGREARGAVVDVDYLTEGLAKGRTSAEDFEEALVSVGKSTNLWSGLWDEVFTLEQGIKALGDETLSYVNNSFSGLTEWVVSALSGSKQAIQEVEDALMAAYRAGNIVESVEAFRALNEQVLEAGGSQAAFNENFKEFLELIDAAEYREALLEGQDAAARELAEEYDALIADIANTIDAFTEFENSSLAVENALFNLGSSLGEAGYGFDLFSEGGRANMEALMGVIDAIAAQTPGDAAQIAANLEALFNYIIAAAPQAAGQIQFLGGMIESLKGMSSETKTATISFASLARGFDSGAASARRAAGAVRQAREEIRTFADYASDLRGVFDRAFDIQFGPQTALDSITLKWIELNEQMRDYRAEVARLTADRAVKEYFLSIAEAYDDQLRAGQLRADLLEIDGKLADAQANVSRETQGNSKAAAQNRGTLQDLVKQYSEYITALASSGLNQDELTAAVNTSIAEFRAQATQLGFSDAALQPYISSLQGLITVINSVPRNISPNLEVRGISAADAAVREFMARARSAVGGGINVPITTSGGGGSLINDLNAQIRGLQARKAALGNDNWSFSDRVAIEKQIQGLQAQIRGIRGWESGGYTGNGGTSAPAGIVHGKEFVFNAQATKNAGVGNLYGMMRAFEQGRGYQAGGYVSAAPSAPSGFGMVVELSPTDRRLLAAAGNVTLTLDGRIVADSTNTVNGVYAKRGA